MATKSPLVRAYPHTRDSRDAASLLRVNPPTRRGGGAFGRGIGQRMNRFVAFLWDTQVEELAQRIQRWSDRLQEISPHWTVVVDRPGMRVVALAGHDGRISWSRSLHRCILCAS